MTKPKKNHVADIGELPLEPADLVEAFCKETQTILTTNKLVKRSDSDFYKKADLYIKKLREAGAKAGDRK
jgi:hypothetical protein